MILMSDTGGGHRASAKAIEDALNELYPNQIEVFGLENRASPLQLLLCFRLPSPSSMLLLFRLLSSQH